MTIMGRGCGRGAGEGLSPSIGRGPASAGEGRGPLTRTLLGRP